MTSDEIAAALEAYFAEHPGDAAAVYLFGSTARGTRGTGSDVDIGVLLDEDPPRTLEGLGFDLQDELERRLGLPVQVVILNRASADLVHRVLRDGRLLLERDRSHRVRFEVAKRAEYFDLLPVLHEYRRLGPPR